MTPLPLRSLACLLALLCLPAIAAEPVAQVRVAFDRDAITHTRTAGLADVAAGREVTAEDPVRVASISKLAVAIGVMRLVEAGRFDLDKDMSALLGWELRHPDHPDRPITPRMLLSHTSGLTDAAGYWQVPLDGRLSDLLADPRAWDREHPPGGYFRYANLNFPLLASAMERATGQRFDRLMRELVFDPLALDACFGWVTCSDAAIPRAVVQYEASGGEPSNDNLGGKRPACPVMRARDGSCDLSTWTPGVNGGMFSPQGGMRISATGLAKIGRLLLRGGEVDGVRLLRPESVEMLFTPQWRLADGNGVTIEEDDSGQTESGYFCRYGLATQTLATSHPDCRDDPFGDGVPRVGHSGSAYGLISGLWLDREAGTGVAYYATGMADAPPGKASAFTAIAEQLARGEAP